MLQVGRFDDVIALLAPRAAAARSPAVWSMLAMAHLQSGRPHEGADALVQSAKLDEEGGRAWLNAATILVSIGRATEAKDYVERALQLGFAPAEAQHLHGQVLRNLGRFDDAEAAFSQAIAERPTLAKAHFELAQLIWMRTGDVAQASQWIDAAIAQHPGQVELLSVRSRLLRAAGATEDGLKDRAAMTAQSAAGPARLLNEAQAALEAGDYAAAEVAARQAFQTGAASAQALDVIANAQTGLGNAADLLATAEAWLTIAPDDQFAIASRASALRLLGNARAAPYRDYEALVRAYKIDTPPGWVTLDSYLSDLAKALAALHPFETHPLDQSVRHGSQTMQSLVYSQDPVIRAFFVAIDGPIRRYLSDLGPGGDPTRARNTGAYKIHGCWSVWLKRGGHHVDHVHPQGWISSACYIALPKAVEDVDRKEGWIRFGRSAVQPPQGLEAEHYVQPKPGRLVLFPSWMWHGTAPFTSDERRLTVAFDVQPG